MFTTTTVPSADRRRLFLALGRLLLSHRPEVARELLPQIDATDRDPSRIPEHFERFCRLQGIDPGDYQGAIYKSKKVEQRKLFIAAMLHLYDPISFTVPSDALEVRWSLVERLAHTLHQNKGNISRLIRQVIVWQRVDEAFRQSVQDIISHLNQMDRAPEA